MTTPTYGYAHKARVVRLGVIAGTYLVEVPALAPGILSGPFMSAVRDLQPGDAVLVLQVGTTLGDLVIVGRLPEREPEFTLPIEISDVTGLAAALDNRATDAELAALEDATNLNFLVVNDKNVEQDGRLDDLEDADVLLQAADVALDGRLDMVEATNTTQDGQITSVTSSVTDLLTWEAWQLHERDVYGDTITTMPRMFASNIRIFSNQVGHIFRTRVRRLGVFTQIRVAVGTTAGAGAGASTTAALYKSTSATGANGPYTLMNSGTNALTALGRANFTVANSSFDRGDWMIILILTNNSYTTQPRLAAAQNAVIHTSILNPTSAGVVFGSKAGLTTPPATISPNDGTWTAVDSPWWVATT